MVALGHEVVVFEPECGWSMENLLEEPCGNGSIAQFQGVYPDLQIRTYTVNAVDRPENWRGLLSEVDVVIVHEWNSPALANALLELRKVQQYRIIFHDTHHRASSTPEQIRLFGVDRFDGVVVFGEVLREIYRDRFGMAKVWTLHEAADTTVFKPQRSEVMRQDVVWIKLG